MRDGEKMSGSKSKMFGQWGKAKGKKGMMGKENAPPTSMPWGKILWKKNNQYLRRLLKKQHFQGKSDSLKARTHKGVTHN